LAGWGDEWAWPQAGLAEGEAQQRLDRVAAVTAPPATWLADQDRELGAPAGVDLAQPDLADDSPFRLDHQADLARVTHALGHELGHLAAPQELRRVLGAVQPVPHLAVGVPVRQDLGVLHALRDE